MVQSHDLALPLALSKIVYKPLAVKSTVPTLVRPTCERMPERDLEMGLHWDLLGAGPSSNSLLLFPPPFTQPYILILDKYSYHTYFMSVKHHQPLSFGH